MPLGKSYSMCYTAVNRRSSKTPGMTPILQLIFDSFTEKGEFSLLIKRMQASFGKLQGQTLELHDGLNILQAPNETGKSTWCAFLLSMFYGINSRERDRSGILADKNRYAPWSGAPMSGRLDCQDGKEELTLLRTTRRPTAPMGDFQALYTGTNTPVPGLSGDSCGETLLGVSREVYARSAFIRQNNLTVTPDAGLERRIASLISTGEEGVSYTEAEDALKKQLNRRRHNKSGQLPALEAELAATRGLLSAQADLMRQLDEAKEQAKALEDREAVLRKELTQLDLWESQRQRQALLDAEEAALQAEQRADTLRRQLAAENIPENESIGRLRGAIINLETMRKSTQKAQAQREEAEQGLQQAETALRNSPFAGMTAEEAQQEAAAPPDGAQWNPLPGVLAIILGLLVAFTIFFGILRTTDNKPMATIALAGLLLAVFTAAWQFKKRAVQNGQANFLFDRFGCDAPEQIVALAKTYAELLDSRNAAQADVNAKAAAAESLLATLSVNEQAILQEIQRFAPEAFDISSGDAALRACAIRRKSLVEANHAVREARMRCELLEQQIPKEAANVKLVPPARGRSSILSEIEKTHASLSAARSKADQLSGRLHATGDPAVLESSAGRLADQIAGLEREYQALQLALSALESANTALQNRFSPALGRRAAEIFAELTSGKYGSVVLDRSFHLAAEPAGTGLPRDAAYLSAGAADQLYLAVRLAICELVLPSDKTVPIVLDDAFATFDDGRCHLALQWLREAARERQVLLFTCHSREAEFFAEDPEVSIQQLTNTGAEV